MMAGMSINSFAAENAKTSIGPNGEILQAVSVAETEEVLKNIEASFVSEKGLLKDV